jgi:uncharacterized protein YjbI with pentapeptide repeats
MMVAMAGTPKPAAELAQLPYAAALEPHDGGLSPDGDYDTLLFDRATFERPSAPNARFIDCAFRTVSFDEGQLQRAGLRDVWMRDVRLTGTVLADSSWRDVAVLNSSLAGAALYGAVLNRVTFTGCKLDSVNFRQAKLSQVRFEDCVLRDVDFGGAVLTKCAFGGSKLTRTDFTSARMDQVDLRGAELGIVIDRECLSGAIMSTAQLAQAAPVLADSLGIVISDKQP